MHQKTSRNNMAVIWNRLLRPEENDMPVEAARFFLMLAFDQQDCDRMHALTLKNQTVILTDDESEELTTYRQVGLVVDLLRAKAHRALMQTAKDR